MGSLAKMVPADRAGEGGKVIPDAATWGKQASIDDLPEEVRANLPAHIRASLES